MPKRKRQAYEAGLKLKVIEFAEANNNSAAEREFGISEKLVRDWRKNKAVLMSAPKGQKKRRLGISPYDDMEMALNAWVCDNRQNGYIVTRNAIRIKAKILAKERKFQVPDTFKASAGWCNRFMRRNNLSIRQRTHIAQKLPKDLEIKVTSFQKFVLNERNQFNYELAQIGNMDETPMCFDMPGNSTVNTIGESTVTIKTSGAEKSHFTVILACMADGTKLLPAVVFKRKTMPKEKFPAGVLILVQQKGWVDEKILSTWVDKVWANRPGGLLKKRSLLVWDMFRVHLMDSIKKKLIDAKTHQAVIPGGTTSVLQPLDVCLNKPFKTHVRAEWNAWMVDGPKNLTKAGNLKRPGLVTVCEWIVKAWDAIPAEMVMRSFLKCSISNSMDGTQDDVIYEDLVSGPSSSAAGQPPVPEESDEECPDMYDELLTEDQFDELFGSSDNSSFEGFN